MPPNHSGFTLLVPGQPSPPMLRRPFRVTPRGVIAHGSFCFDVALASFQFEAPPEDAEQAANDRFESFLDQSTAIFGPVDERKYPLLLESFVEIVVATAPPKLKFGSRSFTGARPGAHLRAAA